ncbi:MAG: type II toxin-antitoxin system RelE/ParE family toxin [Pedobacter sp.]
MPGTVQILQSALFKRAYKRLHPNQKADIDSAIAEIVVDLAKPRKVISQVFFKCNGQLALLAYEYDPTSRLLLLVGSHENFYRSLKR